MIKFDLFDIAVLALNEIQKQCLIFDLCENIFAAPVLTFKLIFDVASKGIPSRSLEDLHGAAVEPKPFHRFQSMVTIE